MLHTSIATLYNVATNGGKFKKEIFTQKNNNVARSVEEANVFKEEHSNYLVLLSAYVLVLWINKV